MGYRANSIQLDELCHPSGTYCSVLSKFQVSLSEQSQRHNGCDADEMVKFLENGIAWSHVTT